MNLELQIKIDSGDTRSIHMNIEQKGQERGRGRGRGKKKNVGNIEEGLKQNESGGMQMQRQAVRIDE